MKTVLIIWASEEGKGKFPSDDNELTGALSSGGLEWPVMDPWGNEYQYEVTDDEKGFTLWSWGPDEENDDGKDDDIVVTDKTPPVWKKTESNEQP
ncbi:MAG: type II secretion system protein GspG [Thermanaeromonas sp.]|nr:type II secretion system protein GspG [Thermanaeromonas sp.]